MVCRHFDYEIWYIKHCTEELRGTRKLLPRNRNKITAVRREVGQCVFQYFLASDGNCCN